MAYDLFQSRRNYNEKCVWWKREEGEDYESDEIIMRRSPSGYFMAKQENPFSKRENTVYNTFLLQKTTITIKTPDNVDGLEQNNIVLYRGEKWFVVSTQRVLARIQQSELASEKNCSHYTYIELRR